MKFLMLDEISASVDYPTELPKKSGYLISIITCKPTLSLRSITITNIAIRTRD